MSSTRCARIATVMFWQPVMKLQLVMFLKVKMNLMSSQVQVQGPTLTDWGDSGCMEH